MGKGKSVIARFARRKVAVRRRKAAERAKENELIPVINHVVLSFDSSVFSGLHCRAPDLDQRSRLRTFLQSGLFSFCELHVVSFSFLSEEASILCTFESATIPPSFFSSSSPSLNLIDAVAVRV